MFHQLPTSIAFVLDLALFISPFQAAGLTVIPPVISNSPLFAGYEALALSVRAVEGLLLGAYVRTHYPLGHFIVIGALFGVLLITFSFLSAEILITMHFAWLGLGALIASFSFTRKLKNHPLVGSPLGIIIVFILFAWLSLHVSSSPTMHWFVVPTIPVGFLIGLVLGKKVTEST